MKAMILAAGFGSRMRPLTLKTPKPLLKAGGKSLIEHQLLRLKAAGIHDVVINVAYLGAQIQMALGDGQQYGMQISYSVETEPLETAGAILNAAPMLGEQPFLLLNADVWCDLDLLELSQVSLGHRGGHLILVPNPEHKLQGDFALTDNSILQKSNDTGSSVSGVSQCTYTYSGIALLSPSLVTEYPNRRQAFPLREVFELGIEQQSLTAQVYSGDWRDIGTPERLQQLDQDLQGR